MNSNPTVEELGSCLIRLAESSGIEPGTDEFEDMVMKRIVDPENRTQTAVKGDTNDGKNRYIRKDTFVPSLDNRYVRYLFLKDMVKWAKRNKGMNIDHAVHILEMDYVTLRIMGEECEKYGMPNFYEWLDGSDDHCMYSLDPRVMSSGCSGTAKSGMGDYRY